MKVLQDVSDLGSVPGLQDGLLLVGEAGAQLFEPGLQLRQQPCRWPRCQQLLKGRGEGKERHNFIDTKVF